MKRIKKTFEIETSPSVMERIERFLALLHYNSSFGHSGTFAMALDGDGQDRVSVSPTPRFQHEVDLLGGIGGDCEIANDKCFTVKNFVEMKSNWIVRPSATMYKNGDQVKSYPSDPK